MESTEEFGIAVLTWTQPEAYDVECKLFNIKDQTIARLTWENDHVIGEGATTKWIFAQSGVFRTIITITGLESKSVEAIYEASWGNVGVLKFISPNTPDVYWRKWSRDSWSWLNQKGEHLINLYREMALKEKAGRVEVAIDESHSLEFQLLILLGWHLVIIDLGNRPIMQSPSFR